LSLVHPYFSVSQSPTLLCPLETCKDVIIWFSNSTTIIITTELESQNAELEFHWTRKQVKMPQANSLLPLDPEVEKQVRASSVLHECQQLVGCPFPCYLHNIVISHEPLSYTASL
jgi:hypothetical protein